MYVKLRDTGSIFYDASQQAKVTGELPVEVKPTEKVNKAIRNKVLVEVDEKEALSILKDNAELLSEREAAQKKLKSGSNNKDLNKAAKAKEKAEKELEEAKAELEAVKEELEAERAAGKELSETCLHVQKELEEAKAELEASKGEADPEKEEEEKPEAPKAGAGKAKPGK